MKRGKAVRKTLLRHDEWGVRERREEDGRGIEMLVHSERRCSMQLIVYYPGRDPMKRWCGRLMAVELVLQYLLDMCVYSVSLRVSGSGSDEGFSRNAVFS